MIRLTKINKLAALGTLVGFPLSLSTGESVQGVSTASLQVPGSFADGMACLLPAEAGELFRETNSFSVAPGTCAPPPAPPSRLLHPLLAPCFGLSVHLSIGSLTLSLASVEILQPPFPVFSFACFVLFCFYGFTT